MQNDDKTVPRFPGEMVRIGDREFVVPPLSFKQIRSLSSDIQIMGAKFSVMETDPQEVDRRFRAMIKVIHTALSRNYPALSKEELEELLDLGNIHRVIEAVMAVSGFVKGKGLGGGPDGSPLTGTSSTPIS